MLQRYYQTIWNRRVKMNTKSMTLIVLLHRLKSNLHQMKMKNMSHAMWIPYSLTFLYKKPLTILSIKFTQKRNFTKSVVKQLSEDYCSKWLQSACFSGNRNYTNRGLFHARSIVSNTGWYSYDSNRKWRS